MSRALPRPRWSGRTTLIRAGRFARVCGRGPTGTVTSRVRILCIRFEPIERVRTLHDVSSPRTDLEAWNAALSGDGAAFAEIFDRYEQPLLRHSRRLAFAPEDADDIVGITFLEAWRKRKSVRFVNGSLLAWLLVTATHTAQNMSRAARRYQRFLQRIPPSLDAPDPADLVENGSALQALRTLSGRHQDVVALCVLQDLSTKDAAAALGIAEGTVKSRLHWAKKRLAERMVTNLHERTT